MNDRDSEALSGLFIERGYSVAESPEEADVILVNTCSVRDHAENRAISFIGSFKKLKAQSSQPRAKPLIGFIGCVAKNRGEELFKKMPHIDLVCSPAVFDKIPEYVETIINEGRSLRIIDLEDKEREEDFYRASFRSEPGQAQVVISTGCSNYCSYCIVPFVRGNLRLRRPKDIIDEVKVNVDLGIKKITLLGQNVNDYWFRHQTSDIRHQTKGDIGFVDLLKKIEGIKGVEEIDFVTSHPKNTSKELFDFMAQSTKMRKHLHLPFQSGSNRILSLMKRGYTREAYLELINYYKEKVKGTLGTDVIVGFPSETEKDFLETKDILERIRFNYAYIFKYSPRPHTQALELKDDVPEEEKKRRHKILLDLQKKIFLEDKG